MIKNTLLTPRRTGAVFAVAALAVAGLSACSSGSSSSAESSATAACPVTVADPWVKAADKGMTAAFGTLTNTSGTEATIVSATTPDSSSMELHEVVDDNGQMVMQPVPGGFPVPANGTLTMEPGGYHMMLMDVTTPIKAGQDVAFTISCSDGGTVDFTAQSREFEGGAEEYQNEGMTDMGKAGESMMPSPSAS